MKTSNFLLILHRFSTYLPVVTPDNIHKICFESKTYPFLANVPILYPLKTPRNFFQGCIKWKHWPDMG